MEVDDVVAVVRARPWAEQPWARERVAAFPATLREVCSAWGLAIEGLHDGGATFPVLDVRLPTGEPAALKVGHGADFAQECRVLVAAGGLGYVRVLEHETDRGALLMERLGPPLADCVPDPVVQTGILTGLLELAWRLPLDAVPDNPADGKAVSLLALLRDDPVRDGPHAVVAERAIELLEALVADPDPDVVVVHGDPHSLNALARGRGHALIDPDGFHCERAYDIGVVLRDHAHTVNRLDATDGPGAGRRWHEALALATADRLGLDVERVLAWAFVERVTTGVWLRRLGYGGESERWLRTAMRMT